MFGSFSESALLAYAEKAAAAYREKRVRGGQGTEYADNLGVGETDKSFIDADESQDPSDYSETYDFTRCMRANGTFYGTAGQCRKGSEVEPAPKKTESKQRKAIRKRGETSLKRATAEKVLEDLKAEGKKERATKAKAEERRRKKDPYTNRDRAGQITALLGKGARTLDRLRARRKKAIAGGAMAQRLDARIQRLNTMMQRLQETRKKLVDGVKQEGEKFGNVPKWATEGRGNG